MTGKSTYQKQMSKPESSQTIQQLAFLFGKPDKVDRPVGASGLAPDIGWLVRTFFTQAQTKNCVFY
jgi:hypothetical protein